MMIKAERMNLLSQALLIKIAEIKIGVEKKVNGNTMRKSVLNQINVRNELNHTFFPNCMQLESSCSEKHCHRECQHGI